MTDPVPPSHGAAAPTDLDAPTAALAAALLEVARHLEGRAPAAPRWFGLVRTQRLLAENPGAASLLGLVGDDGADADEHHLTSVELDHLDLPDDPAAAFPGVPWPQFTSGGAVALDLSADEVQVTGAGIEDLADAERLRAIIGADDSGATWSLLQAAGGRTRMGPALLPDLATAMADRFQD